MFMPFSADEVEESRRSAINDKFVVSKFTIEVDTVKPTDTNKWETGIHVNDGDWVIVQQYNSKIEAEKGHKKWVVSIKKKPKQKLVDVLKDSWYKSYENGDF